MLEEKVQAYDAFKKLQYGVYNGHSRWEMAKTFFSVTNDTFFRIYGFNFVPEGNLFDEAKDFVLHKSNF